MTRGVLRVKVLPPEEQRKLMLPGDLQLAVLGAVWRDKDIPLGRLVAIVCKNYKPVATSTVSTTITRLIERGWVVRTSRSTYRSGITRAELISLLAAKIMEA